MSRKLKILFAINCMNIGGAPSVVFNQIKFLDRGKFEPYLLTLYPSKKANFISQMDFLPTDHQAHFLLKNRSMFDVRTLIAIYLYLRKERFNVVYTHLFLANFLVRSLAIIARVPVILSFEHSTYFNKSRWQIVVDRILAKFTDKIIVPSYAVRDFTADQEKLSEELFAVIPNPIVLPDSKIVDKQSLRKQFGLSDQFIVLTIGRFSEEKGHRYLIEAALIVHQNSPDIHFVVVGHGALEKKLREEIAQMNMESYFHLIHDPERARLFYYISDMFVLPSLREGQPIVLLEAMKAELPIVASALDGVKEIIIDDKNGLLSAPGDSAMLAEKILYLFQNEKKRNMFKEEIRIFNARKEFSPEENVKKIEAVIDAIVKLSDIYTQ